MSRRKADQLAEWRLSADVRGSWSDEFACGFGGWGVVLGPAWLPLRAPQADVAQLVEHFTRNEGVPGSSPGVGFFVRIGFLPVGACQLTCIERTAGGVRFPRREDARPAEGLAGRHGGQLGEHRGLALERLLVAVEGIAVGQLAGVE